MCVCVKSCNKEQLHHDCCQDKYLLTSVEKHKYKKYYVKSCGGILFVVSAIFTIAIIIYIWGGNRIQLTRYATQRFMGVLRVCSEYLRAF